VANGAVVGDGRRPGLGAVIAIMAAEAAGGIVVPDVVGVRAPTDIHGWKYVIAINADQRPCSGTDLGLLAIPDGRIL